MAGQSCKPVQIYQEKEDPQNKKPASATAPANARITPVIIIGNSVLVPVLLTYGEQEVMAYLLMDTGATNTTIHLETADRLNIDLSNAQKAKGKVVGGAVIDARIIKLDSIKVGPHKFENHKVYIVSHEGPPVRYEGLLGMDLLKELKFKLDFQQQAIIWE